MTVIETTIPALADSAQRSFEIVEPHRKLQILVLNLEDIAPADEEPNLQMTGNVVENRKLAQGLVALANQLLRAPGQSLPQ